MKIASGGKASFVVSLAAGYTTPITATVTGSCAGGSFSGLTYTTGTVTGACTVSFKAANALGFSSSLSNCLALCSAGQANCTCSYTASSSCLSAITNNTNGLLPTIAADQIIQRESSGANMALNLQGVPSCVSYVQVLLADTVTNTTPKWIMSIDPAKTPSQSINVAAANTKYTLSVLLQDANGNTLAAKSSPSFMVGDVYLVAGQSNSSNHADVETSASTPYAKVLDVGKGQWTTMRDPMPYGSSWNVLPWNPPGATHVTSGSPWPKFASVLNQELGVPIGVVSIGWGGTGIYDWKKGAWIYDGSAGQHGCHDQALNSLTGDIGCYPRLTATVSALGGCQFKAVLWHQGESDVGNPNLCKGLSSETIGGVSFSGKSNCYAQRLAQIIRDFRADTGCTQPWLNARVSHTVQTSADGSLLDASTAWANETALRGAQTALWSSGVSLRGPDTDFIVGHYRIDDVHFSGSEKACTAQTPYFHYLFSEGFKNGLAIHGQLWAYYVLKGLFPTVSPSSVSDETNMIPELADVRNKFISLLGRTASETDQDVEGLRYWTEKEQIGISKESVGDSISSSDEAYINTQYKLFLSRNATMAEKQVCLNALSSGRQTRASISTQISGCSTKGACSSICL